MPEIVKSTLQKRDSKGVIRHGAEWLALWSDPDSLKTKAEVKSGALAQRTRAEIDRRLAAAARSVSGNPGLQLASNAVAQNETQDIAALRGRIDAQALMLRFHTPELHRQLAPTEPVACRLFDFCEQVRCEAVGASRFFGIGENLVADHRDRLQRADLMNAHLASLVPLAEGLRMVLRDTLLNWPEPSIPSSAFWMWDQWIRARFAPNLKGLQKTMNDQTAYGRLAIPFIKRLLIEVGSDEGAKRRFEPTGGDAVTADVDDGNGDDITDREHEDPDGEIFHAGGDLFLEDDLYSGFEAADELHAEPPPYRIFTSDHDRIVRASDLVDTAELREARTNLDRRRADFRRDFSRLVVKLQRRILARQSRSWLFDLEEGLVDASRLDRVVVNPGFASVYKRERESQMRDSVVSILIDNSGSMRGKPIEIACLASDMIAAALEQCGIGCEILGFTTSAWAGGRSARDWARAGRTQNPGRLNDLLHIIYKSAGEPVRRSRPSIVAMLDQSLLKENVDGEALLWASRRLLLRPESRKVLIVISDGAPVDQATLENNNDNQILDRHLRQVIASIESSRSIEITAIGLKHEVGRYYRNGVQVESAESLGPSLVMLVDNLLS